MPIENSQSVKAFQDLTTPCLLLDEARLDSNIQRLETRLRNLGVCLRPHMKTTKSVDVFRKIEVMGNYGVTVSTLKEAEIFAAAGARDVLYAVGISGDKLPRVVDLNKSGCRLSVVLDSLSQAQSVAAACSYAGLKIPVLIEIDTDGHRAGLKPEDALISKIGRQLAEGGAELLGVMTHAGESYSQSTRAALESCAEQERAGALRAAQQLRENGLPCPVISIGSTPTAFCARDLTGVTEVRAGVYMLFDLVMAGIGVCSVDDIALSVLTTVIGHSANQGEIITDAGWMALSSDRGTQHQNIDYGYGMVCDIYGRPISDLIVSRVSQEHGIVSARTVFQTESHTIPIGSKLRVIPNHSCATAAQFDIYTVVPSSDQPLKRWPRIRGW